MNDIQKWQVEQLATNGGFSDRYIASYVLHKPLSKVSEEEVRQITTYRLKIKALLGNWRNGLTGVARRHTSRTLKAHTKGRRRAKVA